VQTVLGQWSRGCLVTTISVPKVMLSWCWRRWSPSIPCSLSAQLKRYFSSRCKSVYRALRYSSLYEYLYTCSLASIRYSILYELRIIVTLTTLYSWVWIAAIILKVFGQLLLARRQCLRMSSGRAEILRVAYCWFSLGLASIHTA
jgi:hypothetical protein